MESRQEKYVCYSNSSRASASSSVKIGIVTSFLHFIALKMKKLTRRNGKKGVNQCFLLEKFGKEF